MNNSSEDKLLKARLDDMLELSERNFMPVYSDFLDERQAFVLTSYMAELSYADFVFYGGYENAQRKILCVHPQYFKPEPEDFPLNILEFSYRKSDKLTHRDFLGAVMSCSIKREKTGDILVADGKAQVFIINSVADYVCSQITKVGRTGVSLSVTDKCSIEKIQNYLEINGTVASLRLDCILSLALRKSREKTVQIIKKDGVELNFVTVFSSSVTMKENDVFSVRGFGKFILSEISGVSSKGRLHVVVKKFI